MGADVPNRPCPRLRRIRAPVGLLVRGLLGQPILRVFRLNDPQLPQVPARHHCTCLSHQGIAGVVVGQEKPRIRGSNGRADGFGLFGRCGQRFIANNMDARIQKCDGRTSMHMVRRNDRHGIDPVRSRGLSQRHFFVRPIGSVGCNPQLYRAGSGTYRVRGQRTGNKIPFPIDPRGNPVDAADKGALAAPHHSQFQSAHSPNIPLICASSRSPPAKSSKARSGGSIKWLSINGAPSAAPCSADLIQHSHSNTAQLS